MAISNSIFSNTIYSKSSYIGSLEVLEYIIFIIIVYKYNPLDISDKYPLFTKTLTLLTALVYVVLFYFLRENIDLGKFEGQGETGFLIKLLSTLLIFFLSIYFIKKVGSFIAGGNLLGLLRYGILLFILITTLAIGYMFLKPLFSSAQQAPKGSVSSFLFNFLMYMPCLLLSFIDYIKHEYHITTKPVFILLLVEIVFIVLWFIIPLLLNAYAIKNGIQLVKEPQYLNKESVLGTFDELYGKNVDRDINSADNKVERFSYHYSLSAWFYLNPQPPNTSPAYNKYTNILSYGNKPAIEFNGKLNSLRVLVESEHEPGQKQRTEIFETKQVLFQKWNNIVINYDRGTMDVFLNGELVGSKPGIAPYMTFESINVGSNNGLSGGISNVMYFKDNLSRSHIELMYQALRGKAEPYM